MSVSLSVLVPAFNYRLGIERILTSMRGMGQFPVQLIIFDDSSDDQTERMVSALEGSDAAQITYRRNFPALGAIENWNALLDAAQGEYVMLLHHDEFPIGDYFVRDLVTTLRKHPDTDVAVLDCVLVEPKTGRNRRHLPTWLRALVVNHFPQYLYRRNVIGPTAALVVRRSMYPRFDARLQWLVDVDVYVRLLRVAKHLRLCPNIRIGSMLGRSDSITARLGSSIPRMAQEERAYLLDKRSTSSLWLGPYPNESVFHRLLRTFETLCWLSMRVMTRVAARFYPCPIPRTEARQALHGHQMP